MLLVSQTARTAESEHCSTRYVSQLVQWSVLGNSRSITERSLTFGLLRGEVGQTRVNGWSIEALENDLKTGAGKTGQDSPT